MTRVRPLPVGGGTMTGFGSAVIVPRPSANGLRAVGGTFTGGGVPPGGSPPTVRDGCEARGVTYPPLRAEEEARLRSKTGLRSSAHRCPQKKLSELGLQPEMPSRWGKKGNAAAYMVTEIRRCEREPAEKPSARSASPSLIVIPTE